MEFTKTEIRVTLKFSFIKAKFAREAFRDIQSALVMVPYHS